MQSTLAPSRAHEQGAALVMVLFLMIVIVGLAATIGKTSTMTARAVRRDDSAIRAYYVADSGLQIGNATVRAQGDMPSTTFKESIDGGTASISIDSEAAGVYVITSMGTVEGETASLELTLKVEASVLSQAGAIYVAVGSGVTLSGNQVAIKLENNCLITGADHDESGSPLADQSSAVRGLAMNDTGSGGDFGISKDGSSQIEGAPTATMNDAEDTSAALKAIRDYAASNADVVISGGGEFKGSIGSAASPKLVFAHNLGGTGMVELAGGFKGYGTLVIEVGSTSAEAVLNMKDSSSWTGLIVFNVTGDCTGDALIRLQDNCKIIGGTSFLFDGSGVSVNVNEILHVQNQSSVFFSKSILESEAARYSSDFQVNAIGFRRVTP